jgi:hypothetical protein
MTAKYHHCHLQHIAPPDSLWTLYKEIEGELAAEHYTRMEIQEYIKDLQSRYKPSSAESSTKGPPIPEASYISPSPDPDSKNIADTIRGERQANKHDTEPSISSYESDPICSDRSCGREESTLNRMAPVQMAPADLSLLSFACCGTDAGAATAAMREDARNEDRGSVLVVARYYLGCCIW